jgi:dTDP-4-amino-4,6-dideoxygalactose transaminase
MINFNEPSLIGTELKNIIKCYKNLHTSGNGPYSKKCLEFLNKSFGFKKSVLTTSCTDALEMTAILLNLKKEDEVIVPSFTFVSTANAFALRGAKIKFADCEDNFPNISYESIVNLITIKTKAIVVVHYAGFSCDISRIQKLCKEKKIVLIEDCAHAIGSKYKKKFLGTFGDFSTFSFHETKNISCGEGGLLVINNKKYFDRTDVILEKGTNRIKFFKKKISKYEWVDIGSSFVLSEINAAILYTQLNKLNWIQKKRIDIVNHYIKLLRSQEIQNKNFINNRYLISQNNGHIFFIVCKNKRERDSLLSYLQKNKVNALFHYVPLHNSYFARQKYGKISLKNTQFFSDRLIRLPIHLNLNLNQITKITNLINLFYQKNEK